MFRRKKAAKDQKPQDQAAQAPGNPAAAKPTTETTVAGGAAAAVPTPAPAPAPAPAAEAKPAEQAPAQPTVGMSLFPTPLSLIMLTVSFLYRIRSSGPCSC